MEYHSDHYLDQALAGLLGDTRLTEYILSSVHAWLHEWYPLVESERLLVRLGEAASTAAVANGNTARRDVLREIWKLRLSTHEAGHVVVADTLLDRNCYELKYYGLPDIEDLARGQAVVTYAVEPCFKAQLGSLDTRRAYMAHTLAGYLAEPPLETPPGIRRPVNASWGPDASDFPAFMRAAKFFGDKYGERWVDGTRLFTEAHELASDTLRERVSTLQHMAYHFYSAFLEDRLPIAGKDVRVILDKTPE